MNEFPLANPQRRSLLWFNEITTMFFYDLRLFFSGGKNIGSFMVCSRPPLVATLSLAALIALLRHISLQDARIISIHLKFCPTNSRPPVAIAW